MKGKNFMSNINLSEISSLIKKQIEAYKDDIKTETIGTVVEVGDGHCSWSWQGYAIWTINFP